MGRQRVARGNPQESTTAHTHTNTVTKSGGASGSRGREGGAVRSLQVLVECHSHRGWQHTSDPTQRVPLDSPITGEVVGKLEQHLQAERVQTPNINMRTHCGCSGQAFSTGTCRACTTHHTRQHAPLPRPRQCCATACGDPLQDAVAPGEDTQGSRRRRGSETVIQTNH